MLSCRFLTVSISLFATAQVGAQMSFVESAPLSALSGASVSDCKGGSSVSVPLITWGGDLATIYANGGSSETAAGSAFEKRGLKLKLFREDVFASQVKDFLSCKTPYLRGTLAMIHMASELANKDPRSKLSVIYQLTWSAGGDAMVVKGGIQSPAQLKGKTIALQAYGPHVDYLGKILKDAGLSIRDVKLKWTKDLTGTKQSPMNALYQADVDAVMVITPDALKLTSNGAVGTGSEDSVKGARILLSTKTASRIISDVYAVRADYLKSNRDEVSKFVSGLLAGQEDLAALVKGKGTRKGEFDKFMATSAKLLLDSEQAAPDAEGMYGDAAFVAWGGNVKFFTDSKYPRNLDSLNREIKEALAGASLIAKGVDLPGVAWDFASLKGNLKNAAVVEENHFDANRVAQVVAKRSSGGGDRTEGELFSFEVQFKPNQNSFVAADYTDAFKKAVNLAATYAGAVITIEGHSDPLGFLKKKKEGENPLVLSRIRQSAKNLSLTRANGVRDSLLSYAKSRGVSVDSSQFAVVGHGIEKPKSGLCGSDPCPPASEREWLSNMRVEFRIIQVEAEENVFQSL